MAYVRDAAALDEVPALTLPDRQAGFRHEERQVRRFVGEDKHLVLLLHAEERALAHVAGALAALAAFELPVAEVSDVDEALVDVLAALRVDVRAHPRVEDLDLGLDVREELLQPQELGQDLLLFFELHLLRAEPEADAEVLGLDPADVDLGDDLVNLRDIPLPVLEGSVVHEPGLLEELRIVVAPRTVRGIVYVLALRLPRCDVRRERGREPEREAERKSRGEDPIVHQNFSFHFFALSIASNTGSCSRGGAPSTIPRQALMALTRIWLSSSSRKGFTAGSVDLSPQPASRRRTATFCFWSASLSLARTIFEASGPRIPSSAERSSTPRRSQFLSAVSWRTSMPSSDPVDVAHNAAA